MTFTSIIIALTCSTDPKPPARVPAAPAAPALMGAPPLPAVAHASAASAVASSVPPEPQAVAASPEPALEPPPHALSSFHRALRELARGTRRKHVRILWLGDSHGMADFWTGAVRSALQKRFGNAGPGFVHVGYKHYRHDSIRLSTTGSWKKTPRNPATSIRTADGVFGLGGILVTALGGSKATLTLIDDDLGAPDPNVQPDPALGSDETPDAGLPADVGSAAKPPAKMQWDICYRMSSLRDELTLSVNASTEVVKATDQEPPGPLRHVVLTSEGPATLTVLPTQGVPSLCGVIIETDPETRPGVVLDTLGINGARFTTPLAWDEASWASELVRRTPDLFVLEYGTNESGDRGVNPARYGKHLRSLVDRIHRATPGVDCIALAPTDRSGIDDRAALVRDAIRDAAQDVGCAFWDTYEAMGGKGSITAWGAETNPRAAGDGIHLTWRGYRELGASLAQELMRGLAL